MSAEEEAKLIGMLGSPDVRRCHQNAVNEYIRQCVQGARAQESAPGPNSAPGHHLYHAKLEVSFSLLLVLHTAFAGRNQVGANQQPASCCDAPSLKRQGGQLMAWLPILHSSAPTFQILPCSPSLLHYSTAPTTPSLRTLRPLAMFKQAFRALAVAAMMSMVMAAEIEYNPVSLPRRLLSLGLQETDLRCSLFATLSQDGTPKRPT